MNKQSETVQANFRIHYIVMKAFIVFSLGLVFFSCKKEQTNDPDAATLVIQKVEANNSNCTCDPYVNEYKWNNSTVYLLGAAGPTCNWTPIYYNKDGQEMTMTGVSFDSFLQQSIFVRNVWRCNAN